MQTLSESTTQDRLALDSLDITHRNVNTSLELSTVPGCLTVDFPSVLRYRVKKQSSAHSEYS